MKPIVFLTSGTRGDVQPITALARGMQDAGYAVRMAAPPAFRELVESQSVPFAVLEGNPSDLLTEPGSQSALTFNNNPLQGIRAALGYVKAAQPVYARMIENGWHASQNASALVIGLPTIWGTSIAEALGIPCIGAFLQPVTATGEFPSALLPSAPRSGRGYNKLTYWLAAQAVFLPWRGVINPWRRHSLGLKPLPVFHSSFGKMDAVLYGFSRKVVPRPDDWRKNHIISGYWSLKTMNYDPPLELKKFIQSGEKPFYFGFGSPGIHDPGTLIELLIKTINKTGKRAILSLPPKVDLPGQDKKILVLRENVPHDRLFPQMAGIVHHGGAGTTAEALKAGVPSLITPLAADQFFWGERVHALGVGPRAIPQRKLSIENLVNALCQMQDEKMKASAQRLGNELRSEDGIPEAVRVLETMLGAGAGTRQERGGERQD